MSNILRFVVVKVAEEKAAEVERIWKENCGPMMIRRSGCVREELLRCREDPGEYISVSEWESQDAIDNYLASTEHQEIKQHTRGTTGMAATVKTYTLIGG
jgi:heme-degrading monooxygenase HmoA